MKRTRRIVVFLCLAYLFSFMNFFGYTNLEAEAHTHSQECEHEYLQEDDIDSVPNDFLEITVGNFITEQEKEIALWGYNMRDENGIEYSIESTELLYTLDNEPCYALYKFLQGGYSIVERASGTFLEYSFEEDSYPYEINSGNNYYLGTFEYYAEVDSESFEHIHNKKIIPKKYLREQDNVARQSRRKFQYKSEQEKSRIRKEKNKRRNKAQENEIAQSNVATFAQISPMTVVEGNIVKIDNWETFERMPHGTNADNTSCGPVAMGLLLQYYNQHAKCKGKYLPEKYNHELDPNGIRHEALFNELLRITPSVWPLDMIWSNITGPSEHKKGIGKIC